MTRIEGAIIGYFTTVEAAIYVGLAAQTLRVLRCEGRGPRYFRLGASNRSQARYRREDLDAWLEERSFRSTSEEAAQARADATARDRP